MRQLAMLMNDSRRYYSGPPLSPRLVEEPDVTIIRPVKGVEPCLYECLASTFQQSYSKHKLHVRFCVSSRNDPSLPILEQLVRDFPDFDAQIFIEEEDEVLQHGSLDLGPNPKIRNMSRAYREAKGNAIWIIDCNVWVGRYACARMADKLQDNKFVHLLPLVVDITVVESSTPWRLLGGRLEEMFLSSSHAKFYTAINTVLLAPCIVGKSTMFRKSHLDSLTDGRGIDYFSYNICEDHLIGDLLWKRSVPEERGELGRKLGKHAMCFGDLAIQPVSGMSTSEYWNRRVRWLRVRKFTVLIATLVEPGTESVVCSLYLAFAVTALPFFHHYLAIPPSWSAFASVWLLSELFWCAMDWTLHKLLHSGASVHFDENTPSFVHSQASRKRTFPQWLLAWLGREFLAFPIWSWAFYGGATVEWRGKKLWVGLDLKVHEISDSATDSETAPLRPDVMNGHRTGHEDGKARRD